MKVGSRIADCGWWMAGREQRRSPHPPSTVRNPLSDFDPIYSQLLMTADSLQTSTSPGGIDGRYSSDLNFGWANTNVGGITFRRTSDAKDRNVLLALSSG